jgi:hypothetical protein
MKGQIEILCTFLISHLRVSYTAHLTIFDLITLIIFGEVYK